jgi:hypothetical protein
VVCRITKAERSGGVDTLGSNILLIAVLPVEVENVFQGQEVAGFVSASACIFDVICGEFVFARSCDSGVSDNDGTVVALITVAVSVFLATERLDARDIRALGECFEQYGLDIFLSDELGKGDQRYRIIVVDAQFEPHVEFSVY